MGNETSTIVCVSQNCAGIENLPFLPLGLALLFMIYYPFFFHVIRGGVARDRVVSISQTWRVPYMYTVQWMVIIPIVVFYSICLTGGVLIMLWAGVLLLGLVATINPHDKLPMMMDEVTATATSKAERDAAELLHKSWKRWHQRFAMLLFSYMLGIGIFLAADEFTGTDVFAFSIVLVILMCVCYVGVIVSALTGKWVDKTSFLEFLFCTAFIFLLILILHARVC